MNRNKTLRPYEELTITRAEDQHYVFSVPWLSLKLKVETNTPQVHQTLIAYAEKDLASVDFEVLSRFLNQLSLPMNYILPAENQAASDLHVAADAHATNAFSKSQFRKFLGLSPSASEWNWDTEAILDFAKLTENTHDPSAILSVVRRFHLLDCIDNDKTALLYEFCKSGEMAGSASLNQKLATIVYQNYYVTEQCQRSLQPALQIAASAEDKLRDFMSDEEGHDLLLIRAVNTLHADLKSLYLADSTQNIMNLLRQMGEKSFLAFSLAIDFFEKPNFDNVDPLAELLLFFKKEISADCLQKHKDINDGGEHDAIALSFLGHMKPISAEDAVFAIRFAEILTDEMTSVTAELLQEFQTKTTTIPHKEIS